MYTKHLNNAPRKMQGIAKNFNPMSASSTIAGNLVPKHPKRSGVKIWHSYGYIMGRLQGNTYIKSIHGAIGSDKDKEEKLKADMIQKGK